MGLFDRHLKEIRAWVKRKENEGRSSAFLYSGRTDWPRLPNRNLVMAQDTAVELGHPKTASTAFLFWVDDPAELQDGRISIVGPDLPQLQGKQASFGRVVVAAGENFTADNSFERFREMELLRYDLHLEGYMMRAVSQYQREWSRVSQAAVDKGFSFKVLGGALIDRMRELNYVKAVETIFVTSGPADVLELAGIAEDVCKIIGAMNKMAADLSFDCDTCEYNAVCSDVAELRRMHTELRKKGTASYA